MRDPWVPVADLMSGFSVVALLMFAAAMVMPVLSAQVVAEREARRVRSAAEVRRERIESSLDALEAAIRASNEAALAFDRPSRVLEFRDVSFASGSACLSTSARRATDAIAPRIRQMLTQDQGLMVFVEGHTDPAALATPRVSCGHFADNLQLSLERARNVRDLLLGTEAAATRRRVPVTGFGPERLRNEVEPTAPENRRVEVRFVWDDGHPDVVEPAAPSIKPAPDAAAPPAPPAIRRE